LLAALASRNVKSVTLSYLHLRPAILEQLVRELPATESSILRGCCETQPWRSVGGASRSKLIPLPLRKNGYKCFSERSREYGLKTLICSFKNPDMPGDRCSSGTPAAGIDERTVDANEQLSLFAC
jgi:hypothetical protein